ncbi:MAG: ATP synthase subunit I [Oscillospiraceae bacterium]|nr:ATP synthase subunit I [Oscillospiraceae bacterium]
MKSLSDDIKREISFITAWIVIFSAVMQGVFLILHFFGIVKWDYTAVLGNLFGAVFSVLNFVLLGFTVEAVVNKEEKQAQASIRISRMLRNLMIGAVIIIGIYAPIFNIWTVALPFFFPKIGILLRSKFMKKPNDDNC